jgi:hypothetical protein
MPSIHFLDVTNRDGVQTARTGLSKFGKVTVNFYLGRLGVAQSEIGFPFLFHEVPYVRACPTTTWAWPWPTRPPSGCSPPAGRSCRPRRPPLPAADFPTFLAACRRYLPRREFAQVARLYYDTAEATDAWWTPTALPAARATARSAPGSWRR